MISPRDSFICSRFGHKLYFLKFSFKNFFSDEMTGFAYISHNALSDYWELYFVLKFLMELNPVKTKRLGKLANK